MDINICDSLRSLRRDKGNTQEELACFLDISTQAVSKWERGERYPDITLLPKIAAYYNVTVDDLLGVGEVQKKERIDEINKQYKNNSQIGDINANIELMRSALKEFSNDYNIINQLISTLYLSNNEDYFKEIIELGERIINNCTEDDLRSSALQTLCFVYATTEKYDIAKEYALRLPIYVVTQNQVLNTILKGDELLKNTQYNLHYLIDLIQGNITWMLRAKEYNDAEKLYMYRKILQFYELLYEDGDYGFYHCRLIDIYFNIAVIYAKQSNHPMTLENLAHSIKHAATCDTMEDHKLTAPLVNTTEYKASNTSRNWMGTYCCSLLSRLTDSCFDFCREDIEFIELIDKLKRCNL